MKLVQTLKDVLAKFREKARQKGKAAHYLNIQMTKKKTKTNPKSKHSAWSF